MVILRILLMIARGIGLTQWCGKVCANELQTLSLELKCVLSPTAAAAFFFGATMGATVQEPSGQSASLMFLPNISNPDRLSADSGWLYGDILARALTDLGVKVVLAGPAPSTDTRVGYYPMNAPKNKYFARYDSDINSLSAALRAVSPAVVVANQVETVPSLRVAMLDAGLECRLVSYCHYLPFVVRPENSVCVDSSQNDAGLGTSTILHFLAGLASSDAAMVHSEVARRWICTVADKFGVDIGRKLVILPPPRDPRLVRAGPNHKRIKAGLEVALYNHRLYEHYGTANFVELAVKLQNVSSLQVQVTDMFGSRERSRVYFDSTPERYLASLASLPNVNVVSDRGSRTAYRQILSEASFAIAPFREGCSWSMSVVDCQAMGVPVMAPRRDWFSAVVDADLLFDSMEEAVDIARRLTMDKRFRRESSDRAFHSTSILKPEIIAEQYRAILSI